MGTTAVVNTAAAKAERSHVPAILVIAIVARLAMTLVYVHETSLVDLHRWGYENIFIALSLAGGYGFSSPFGFASGPTALLAPGYPLLIAGVVHLVGTGPVAPWLLMLLNNLVSLVTLWLVMKIADQHFGTRTANISGLLFALSPPVLFAAIFIWDTCISAMILTAAVCIAASTDWSAFRSVLLGIGTAVAVLINPALSLVLFAIFAWSAYRARVFPWIAIIAFLIAFSPWPIRNALVMHSFIPLRTSFGYELWMGNHAGGDGNLPADLGPRDKPSERSLFLQNGEVKYVQLKESLAQSYILAHPAEFAKITGKRFIHFWAGTGKGAGCSSLKTYYLAALSFAGLVLLFRQRRTFILFLIPLLIFPLPYYITHAEVRYQFVVDPLLIILAGFACESFFAWCARRTPPAATFGSVDN